MTMALPKQYKIRGLQQRFVCIILFLALVINGVVVSGCVRCIDGKIYFVDRFLRTKTVRLGQQCKQYDTLKKNRHMTKHLKRKMLNCSSFKYLTGH